tara:strand:- start:335 stop:769 length:435 start_codon:yes stop_codon:yes gene_type:complete
MTNYPDDCSCINSYLGSTFRNLADENGRYLNKNFNGGGAYYLDKQCHSSANVPYTSGSWYTGAYLDERNLAETYINCSAEFNFDGVTGDIQISENEFNQSCGNQVPFPPRPPDDDDDDIEDEKNDNMMIMGGIAFFVILVVLLM